MNSVAFLPSILLFALAGLAACSNGPGPKSASDGGDNNKGSPDMSKAGLGGSSSSGGDESGGGQAAHKTYVYVGSGDWSGTTGKLQVFSFDEPSTALTLVQELAVGNLNSFLAFHPTESVLYAGDETGKKLRAYSIDRATGKLAFLNEAPTSGGPVYISVDRAGKYALLAYYNEGSVEVFSLGANGAVQGSVDQERTGDKAHSIVLDPAERFAFVPNLGSNTISQLTFDKATGKLGANEPPSVARAGGPRHLAFSPSGDRAYVVNELDSTVSSFSYAGAGKLVDLETISNTAAGYSGAKSGGDIHLTPDGKYLYATNRAGDQSTLGTYAVGPEGKLSPIGFESSRGSTPRNFAIHPNGKLLLVGNQDSNNVASFRIGADGKLEHVATTPVGVKSFWVGFRVVPG